MFKEQLIMNREAEELLRPHISSEKFTPANRMFQFWGAADIQELEEVSRPILSVWTWEVRPSSWSRTIAGVSSRGITSPHD